MNTVTKTLSWTALCCAVYGMAAAQPPPPSGATPDAAATMPAAPAAKARKATAQSEAGEPRAATSDPPATADPPATSPATPSARRAPSAAAPAGQAPVREPGGRAGPDSGSGQKSAAKVDRLELGMATVTGDREQPKVMYIVPWKKSDIGDLTGKPMNSLVDEILAPVDRDVFKREVVYYQAAQTDASQNGAPPKPAQQGEK